MEALHANMLNCKEKPHKYDTSRAIKKRAGRKVKMNGISCEKILMDF